MKCEPESEKCGPASGIVHKRPIVFVPVLWVAWVYSVSSPFREKHTQSLFVSLLSLPISVSAGGPHESHL